MVRKMFAFYIVMYSAFELCPTWSGDFKDLYDGMWVLLLCTIERLQEVPLSLWKPITVANPKSWHIKQIRHGIYDVIFRTTWIDSYIQNIKVWILGTAWQCEFFTASLRSTLSLQQQVLVASTRMISYFVFLERNTSHTG